MQTNERHGGSQERKPGNATNCYTWPQFAARNRLASCPALAILSRAHADVPRRNDAFGGWDLRADAGITEQGNYRTAACSAGARWPDRLSHTPFPTPMTRVHVSKLRRLRETFRRSGTCCVRRRSGGSTRWLPALLREMHRSTTRRKRVNSFRAVTLSLVTLSLELCSRFLNELALPVNIAYEWGIMSRICDMSGRYRSLLMEDPRIVDATG